MVKYGICADLGVDFCLQKQIDLFFAQATFLIADESLYVYGFVLYDQTFIAKYFWAEGWPQNITQPYGGWGATKGDVAKLGTWRRLDDSLYNGRAFVHPLQPPVVQRVATVEADADDAVALGEAPRLLLRRGAHVVGLHRLHLARLLRRLHVDVVQLACKFS